jgi:hypothetical protein
MTIFWHKTDITSKEQSLKIHPGRIWIIFLIGVGIVNSLPVSPLCVFPVTMVLFISVSR